MRTFQRDARRPAKILLVEDNALNADMLRRRLQRAGFEVVVASDGLQAVAQATHGRPDLILMDISLPEIDGWEATRLLKGDLSTAAIPVIALTAHAMIADRARSFEAGCQGFETKPIDFVSLLARIRALLPPGVAVTHASPPLLVRVHSRTPLPVCESAEID